MGPERDQMADSGRERRTAARASAHIRAGEWWFVLWVTLAVLAVTALPYLFGYVSSPPDRQYMGLLLDVPDHGQYLSWWRQFQSAFLIRNTLTPEPNSPVFFNLLWWVLAQVSRLTGLDYAPVYQAFRWVAGGTFLWAVYRLVAQFLPQPQRRRTAFLLVVLSSGLGWALVVLKYTLTRGELLFPLDVHLPDGNAFLCILGYPHLAFAMAFIALTLEFIWRGWSEERMWYYVVAGVLALLLAWQHAYDMVIIYGVTAVFALLVWWRRRQFPWRLLCGGAIVFGLSCSGPIYSLALTRADPLWEEVLAQFANAGVYTPMPPHLFVLFGIPLVLSLVAIVGIAWRRRWSEENLFVAGWFVLGAGLLYIPTDFQIHMLNSWQIPMMILTTKALYDMVVPAVGDFLPLRKRQVELVVSVALLLLVVPTNLYLLVWRFVDLGRHDYPYYLHRDDVAALMWLSENTLPEEVVFSSLILGQYVPAVSGNTAFLAHWAQTVGFYDKRDRVSQFYSSEGEDEERLETLCTYGVRYVVHGPAERGLGAYDPAAAPFLSKAFAAGEVTVYAVVDHAVCQSEG